MIKGFSIYPYIIFMSVIIGICVQIYLAAKKGFSLFDLIMYVGFECFGIIFGSKTINFIFNNPNNLNFFKVGLNSSGALLGAILMILLYSFARKKEINSCFTIFVLSTPLIYSIGKIGCYISGCCVGFVYDGIGKVYYKYVQNPTNMSYFPIQLIESITFFIFFIIVFFKFNQKQDNKLLCSKTLIIGGTIKFILDYFRLDHVSKIITINQLLSIFIVLIGIWLFLQDKKITDIK